MQRRYVALLLIGVLILAAGLVSYFSIVGPSTTSRNVSGVVGEARDIPIYPGARMSEVDATNPGEGSTIRYFVDVPISVVEDFYRKELGDHSWREYESGHSRVYGISADWRTPEPGDTAWLEFYKLGDVGLQPYDLFLQLDISDSRRVGFPAATERTLVTLYLTRVPIISDIPLLPDATRVETIRTGNTGIGPFASYSFETGETRSDVQAFYAKRLPSYGWHFGGEAIDPNTGEKISESMVFVWHFGGVETRNWGSTIEVITNPLPGNRTKVFLTVAGATNLR